MKYINVKKKYQSLNLQLFAEEGDNGEDTGGDDQGGDENPDEDGDSEEPEEEEKKFSQKDVDETVKKRLAREKRKWQRQQNTSRKTDSGDKAGEDADPDDKETQELRAKAQRVEELELKWTCLEHDVDKSCVDDVLALARVKVAKDQDLDIEDAIEEVLKKYPQFKTSSSGSDEDNRKSWGQRQTGKGAKKISGVESRFYELNPDLK